MNTKYNIGDKVILKAIIDGISATKDGVMYQLTVFDGAAGWNNHVSIKESLLVKMNKKESDNEFCSCGEREDK